MSPEFIDALGVWLEILATAFGAMAFALWAGIIVWTVNDMRARSWDVIAAALAALLVAAVPFAGWVVYLLVRPKETLAEAYDRALEEEALLKDAGAHFHCPQCHAPAREEWAFCPQCQTQLLYACRHCGQNVRGDWKFCVYCRATIPTDPQSAAPAPAQAAFAAARPQTPAPRRRPETAPPTPH